MKKKDLNIQKMVPWKNIRAKASESSLLQKNQEQHKPPAAIKAIKQKPAHKLTIKNQKVLPVVSIIVQETTSM